MSKLTPQQAFENEHSFLVWLQSTCPWFSEQGRSRVMDFMRWILKREDYEEWQCLHYPKMSELAFDNGDYRLVFCEEGYGSLTLRSIEPSAAYAVIDWHERDIEKVDDVAGIPLLTTRCSSSTRRSSSPAA